MPCQSSRRFFKNETRNHRDQRPRSAWCGHTQVDVRPSASYPFVLTLPRAFVVVTGLPASSFPFLAVSERNPRQEEKRCDFAVMEWCDLASERRFRWRVNSRESGNCSPQRIRAGRKSFPAADSPIRERRLFAPCLCAANRVPEDARIHVASLRFALRQPAAGCLPSVGYASLPAPRQ